MPRYWVSYYQDGSEYDCVLITSKDATEAARTVLDILCPAGSDVEILEVKEDV